MRYSFSNKMFIILQAYIVQASDMFPRVGRRGKFSSRTPNIDVI